MARIKKQRHLSHVFMCALVSACVYECDYGESTRLRIFVISLVAFMLYTRAFALIFVMWDYFGVFMCTGDVASYGASDSHIKRCPSIFT